MKANNNTKDGGAVLVTKEITIIIDAENPKRCGVGCPHKGSNEIMNRSYCRLFNNFLTNSLQNYTHTRLGRCIDIFGNGDDAE